MKEYDIFLKRRLAEGTIIVYSLPYRDGVSVVQERIGLVVGVEHHGLRRARGAAAGHDLDVVEHVEHVDDREHEHRQHDAFACLRRQTVQIAFEPCHQHFLFVVEFPVRTPK